MEHIRKVKIKYRETPYDLSINYDGRDLDISRIRNMPISEWAFPFRKNETDWKGIYEELKEFTGEETFTIQFEGDKGDFEMLKAALINTKARLISSDNTAVILYSENPYTTKINVNGELFDTSRIQNRSIEEWIKPIELRGFEWKGIFRELEDFIGTDEYNIRFMGEQDFMKPLMDACPNGVNVTYRVALKQDKKVSAGGTSGAASAAKSEISNAAGLVKRKIREEVTDEEVERNLENIPIKNKLVRQHLMAICAGIIYLFMLLPFVTYTVAGEVGAETGGMAGGTGNAYEALGGLHSKASLMGQHAAIPGWNTAFAIALIVIPGIIIAMNYVNKLKPYRRIIAIVGPAAGIAFEFITIIALHGKYFSVAGIDAATAANAGLKLSTMVGAGFVLMIIMYVVTAIVGLITFYGYKLPSKK